MIFANHTRVQRLFQIQEPKKATRRQRGVQVLLQVLVFSCLLAPPSLSIASLSTKKPIYQPDIEITKFSQLIDSPEFNINTCAKHLEGYYKGLYSLNVTDVDTKNLSPDTVRSLWNVRQKLRDRLAQLYSANQSLPEDCIEGGRKIFRAGRALEDFIGEMTLQNSPKNGFPEITRVFTGPTPSLLINPQFASADLQSGDVLMSRGAAPVSATIARITDQDSQFSHVAMIYIDPNKKIWTIEAHIEIGVVVAPLEKYLSDKKTRSVIYRYKDANLASKAAKAIYDVVNNAEKSGHRLKYDFAMEKSKHNRVFCAEVVSWAFEMASNGRVSLPLFQSTMKMNNRRFFDSLGISTQETFAPVDMEMDFRFGVVAEWRDYQRMTLMRQHDSIMTSIFSWMENGDYAFDVDLSHQSLALVAWSLRHTPVLALLVRNKLPTNMSMSTIATMSTLDQTFNAILAALQNANKNFRVKYDYPMTFKENMRYLEKLRSWDFGLYLNFQNWQKDLNAGIFSRPQKPVFHLQLHPFIQQD